MRREVGVTVVGLLARVLRVSEMVERGEPFGCTRLAFGNVECRTIKYASKKWKQVGVTKKDEE